MNETKFFGVLLSSHPNYLPILQNIREKYNIPEVGLEDNGITEILLADENIDWQAVRQEIETQFQNNPNQRSFSKATL